MSKTLGIIGNQNLQHRRTSKSKVTGERWKLKLDSIIAKQMPDYSQQLKYTWSSKGKATQQLSNLNLNFTY